MDANHETWDEVQQDTTDFFKGDPDIQSKLPIASFTVNGTRVAFSIEVDELEGGNRLVPHDRPYRPGTKIDSTGAMAWQWTATAIFNNTLDEPGLDTNTPQYPDNLNALIDLFAEQATGDLVTPSDGNLRARAWKFKRKINPDETDTARVELVFLVDNEDNVDATAFSRPNVRGSLTALAQQTTFTAQSEGAWGANLADLKEFCSDLEGIINAPGEQIDSVVIQTRAAQNAIRGVVRTLQAQTGPDAPIQTINNLKRLLDIAAWSSEEHNQNPPRRVPYVVNAVTTIFAIASDVRQDPDDLMELNEGRIDDPFAVQPGTYRVLSPST
jgi:prophage DNA circulation protein